MRLCVFTEPHLGASYDDQLAVARRAEAAGYEAFFRSDHFLAVGPALARGGLPGPTDSWVTLGGLARETSRIRLGTLVTSATFRLPGLLAIAVAQVDAMSGGRLELGLGAGWYGAEHEAYGVPFPPTSERLDRLSEQLAIVTGLWSTPSGERFSFQGKYYRLVDSPALPKPVQQPGPPVIVGGLGRRRTPALAARYADEFNVPFGALDDTRRQYRLVAEACEREGRDASGRTPLALSVAQTVACGRTETEARRRAEAVGRDPDRGGIVIGTPERVAEQLRAFGEIGVQRVFLQFLDLSDLDHLDLVAAEVGPLLR